MKKRRTPKTPATQRCTSQPVKKTTTAKKVNLKKWSVRCWASCRCAALRETKKFFYGLEQFSITVASRRTLTHTYIHTHSSKTAFRLKCIEQQSKHRQMPAQTDEASCGQFERPAQEKKKPTSKKKKKRRKLNRKAMLGNAREAHAIA